MLNVISYQGYINWKYHEIGGENSEAWQQQVVVRMRDDENSFTLFLAV